MKTKFFIQPVYYHAGDSEDSREQALARDSAELELKIQQWIMKSRGIEVLGIQHQLSTNSRADMRLRDPYIFLSALITYKEGR